MGHKRLYEVLKEKDAIYMKEDFTDEDGIRAAELEGEFAELNGWEAEPEAAVLLQGLNIPEELHHQQMSELTGGQKVKVLSKFFIIRTPLLLHTNIIQKLFYFS
ncbi:hypothetical protein EfmAA242_00320 [Enterococcus faecium]|nr:hypothetical protein EfmAA242_00320 [Enterococcus faecium]